MLFVQEQTYSRVLVATGFGSVVGARRHALMIYMECLSGLLHDAFFVTVAKQLLMFSVDHNDGYEVTGIDFKHSGVC